SEVRRRDRLLVTAGQVDREQLRSAAGLAEEHQHAAIWRPGRAFLQAAGGEDALARAVGAHHADLELAGGLLGEGDEVAARGPDRRRIGAVAEGDALRVRAIRAHRVDVRTAAAIRREDDAAAVRRIGRRSVDRV